MKKKKLKAMNIQELAKDWSIDYQAFKEKQVKAKTAKNSPTKTSSTKKV